MIQGLIYNIELGKRHKEPLLKNITTTRFPYREHINTLSPVFDNADDFLASLKEPEPIFMSEEELSCLRHRYFCIVMAGVAVASWATMIVR